MTDPLYPLILTAFRTWAGKITMPRIPQSRAAAFSERDEERLLAYLRGEG